MNATVTASASPALTPRLARSVWDTVIRYNQVQRDLHDCPPLRKDSDWARQKEHESKQYAWVLKQTAKWLGLHPDELVRCCRPDRQENPGITAQSVWDAMPAVEPQAANGALVSVAELRRHLGDPDRFDALVLELADRGLIALHHTDGAPRFGSAGLVRDGSQWVIGIARR